MRSTAVIHAIVLLSWGGLWACGESTADDPGTGTVSAIDHDLWEVVPVESDPFSERFTEESYCATWGYFAEDIGGEYSFSINTRDCNYLTVSQPSLRALSPGDMLTLRLYHFELRAPEAAEAYAAIAIGGAVVWEERVPIPSPSGLVRAEWEVTSAAPEGTSILFHLDNHGLNSWSLIDLTVTPN